MIGEDWEVGLLNELCEHLQRLGIVATVLDLKSPEAVHHTAILYALSGIDAPRCVKVEGRNIDIVEAYRVEIGRKGIPVVGESGTQVTTGSVWPGVIVYLFNYLVLGIVGNLEDELKAEIKPIKKGLFSKEVVGFEWKGGHLAGLLNADSDLKGMLLNMGLPNLAIRPNKRDEYVAITQSPRVTATTIAIDGVPVKYEPAIRSNEPTVEMKVFPTLEAFEAYDGIARHIHRIITYSSQ